MLQPLPERMRPQTLEEYVGQGHLVGKGAVISRMVENDDLKSFILWGPPGVGKTTLARIVARTLKREFYTLSAVSAGVKEVREVIDKARSESLFSSAHSPVLFIDEIHRFNKSQQDALLGAVEEGVVTLIGATTENPSFEVITPLLSRCQVFVLRPLGTEDLDVLLHRAITEDTVLKTRKFDIRETEALFRYSGGDARKLLNIIDLLASTFTGGQTVIVDNATVTSRLNENITVYDKGGEMHYDIISAFIKSIRGSDPNAADPNAMLLANACFNTVHNIGMPEARIPLSETAIYLASSPKSNSAYLAIDKALALARETQDAPVPLYLRNAPTKLMEELGYSDGYKYAHDYPGHWTDLEFMPQRLSGTALYEPADNRREAEMQERLSRMWPKYNYGKSGKSE